MSSGLELGPPVDDAEDVYRAILSPSLQWVEEAQRPSSALFDDEKFSVDIKSRTTPEITAARYRDVTRIVEFNCGGARAFGFDTREELDEAYPENLAHAHVYFTGTGRKKKARKLVDICKTIFVG